MTSLVEVLDEHRTYYAVNRLAEFMTRSPLRVGPQNLVEYDVFLTLEAADELIRLGWRALPEDLNKWVAPDGSTGTYGREYTFEVAVWVASGREFEPHFAWAHWEDV